MPSLAAPFYRIGVKKVNIITRNNLLLEYQPLVKWTIRHNWTLIRALRLEPDDVYQELCIAALKAIEGFDPLRSNSLKTHILAQLQYEILDIKRSHKPNGLTCAGKARVTFISLDYQPKEQFLPEIPVEDASRMTEIQDALSRLAPAELSAVMDKVKGRYHAKKQERATLATALEQLAQYFELKSIVELNQRA